MSPQDRGPAATRGNRRADRGLLSQLLPFRARRGAVFATEVDGRPEGALDQWVELPLDEVATVTLAGHGAGIRAVRRRLGLSVGESDELVERPLAYDDDGSTRDLFARVAKPLKRAITASSPRSA